MAKFKVQHDGKDIEVELDAIPLTEVSASYVPKAVHDREFARLRKQIESVKAPDELLEDSDFRTKALAHWKIDGKPSAADAQAMREQFMRTEVDPLKKQLTQAQEALQRGRQRDLHLQIVQAAAAAGFRKKLLSPPENAPNAPPPVVNLLSGYFRHDGETDGWWVANGDKYAYAAKPTETAPYKGVAEFISEFVAANPDFVEKTTQTGPNARPVPGGAGNPGGNAVVTAGDPLSFGRSLESIAQGKATFSDG